MIKGTELNLGGTDYIVPPLNLASLEDFQERIKTYSGGIDSKSVELVVDVAHAAIKRNYPEVTKEQLKEWIDLGNIQEVFEAVMNISGLTKRMQVGEATAPVQA